MSMKEKLSKITKQFGGEMVLNLGDMPSEVEVISTGVPGLDRALQIVDARTGETLARTHGQPVLGGYPRGRVVELFGPEGGGKTTLGLTHLAEVIKLGGDAVFIDVENKLQYNYAKALLEEAGANPRNLTIITPPHAEAAWESVLSLVGEADSVVLDSVAEMMTQARMDTPVGDQQPGMLARVVKDGLYKSKIGTSKTILLVVNQIRDEIGGYGWSERVPGGHSLLHKCIARIRVSRIGGAIKEGGKEVGITVRAKVHKNQVGIPNAEVKFKLYWGIGIDNIAELCNIGQDMGLIKKTSKNSSWLYLDFENPMGSDEDNTVNGAKNMVAALRESPETVKILRDKIGEATGAEL